MQNPKNPGPTPDLQGVRTRTKPLLIPQKSSSTIFWPAEGFRKFPNSVPRSSDHSFYSLTDSQGFANPIKVSFTCPEFLGSHPSADVQAVFFSCTVTAGRHPPHKRSYKDHWCRFTWLYLDLPTVQHFCLLSWLYGWKGIHIAQLEDPDIDMIICRFFSCHI